MYKRGTRFSKLLRKSSLGISELQLPFRSSKHSCTQIKQTAPIPHPADLDTRGENELPNYNKKKGGGGGDPPQMTGWELAEVLGFLVCMVEERKDKF